VSRHRPGSNPPVAAVYQHCDHKCVGYKSGYATGHRGNGISNTTFQFDIAQIQYAGTGASISMVTVNLPRYSYAPNAAITFSGNAQWYGSVIGSSIGSNGNASVSIHYDRALQNNLMTVGNWTLDTFT